MASQLLSAAEAGPWREDKVLPSDRGISLHWLCNFVADLQAVLNEPREQAMREADSARSHNKAGRWGRHDMPDREIPEIPPYCFLNTHALVSQFVVPLTKEIRAPLFALVPPEHRGRPTTFISHTWNSLLVGPQQQRIGTLDAVYTEEDEFVWIDFACYNQNGVDNSKISEDMEGVVKTIDKLVVAVTPTPLYSRSWCLWELYCADIAGLTPEFRVRTGFRNDKIQAVNALYRSFSGIENAHSISARDEEQIRNAFISRHGGVEPANAAIKAMLERHLSSKWHELQPDDGPLKFSSGPWIADPEGATLRAYHPYWEPGLLDCLIYGSKQTVREVFASAGVYIGAQEKAALSVQQSDPANRRLIAALQNEDVEAIMSVAYADSVDLNQPLPFRSALSFEVAPPLHFLMPWAQRRTIEALLLVGADVNLPWAFLPETKSAAQHKALVGALLSGVGDPQQAEWTPLMLAVQRGDANICTWLIEHGALMSWPSPPPPGVKSAFVNFRCPKTGLTALHLAAAGKRSDLVRLLLQSGAAVDDALISGITALHIAAAAGDVDSINLLLKSGADQSLCDRTGRSAQEWAQECKHPEAAELLGIVVSPAAAAPATTPRTNVDFGTLMKAIRAGDVAAVQTAISRGIDPAKGAAPDSPTPFGFAVAEGSSNIVRLMLQSGVNPNASVAGGSTTALSLAADKGRSEIVRMLLASGATVDAEEQDGRTALVWAAERGNDEIVTSLLDCGADVNHVVRSNGATALHAATQKEHEATVALLLARGARVDLATTGGNTALHFAAFAGNAKIVSILLAHGADATSANRQRKSARDIAREQRKADVLRLLEEPFAAAPATVPKGTPEPRPAPPPVTPTATTAPAATPARATKTYAELRREFADDWPTPSSGFLGDVLWALHRDPNPAASLKLSCDNPPFPVVDAVFEKKPDGITSTVHVQDNKNQQRPSQTTVMHYTLVDGTWQSKATDPVAVAKAEQGIARPAAVVSPPAANPATSTTTAYETLRQRFRKERPALTGSQADQAFLSEVLWTLQSDPATAASVTLGFENQPHYDVEITFNKTADGIESTLNVTDDRPMHIVKARYWLVDGAWKAEELSHWQRN